MIRPDPTRHPEAERYTGIAQALHWTVVALLIVQFTLAWIMPEIHRGTAPETLINLHLSFGLVILAVIGIRFLWRMTHSAPPSPKGLPAWQLLSSRVVHALQYMLLFAIPILGWVNASYRGWTVTVFGWVHLPSLVPPRSATPAGAFIGPWTGDVHIWLSYGLLALVSLYVSGALYHRFVLRDRVLARMIPGA